MNPDRPDLSFGDFYCKVCDTHINSELTWTSHIVGKRHIKNVAKEMPESTRYDFDLDNRKDLKKELKYVEGPIVGLSNICEYVRRQSSYFNCFLCSAILPTPFGVVEHITSLDHKLNYIKHVEPEQHKSITETQLSKDYLTPLVDEKCFELINRLGQGEVMVKLENSQKDDRSEKYLKDDRRERHERYQKDDGPEIYLKDYRRERHEKYKKDDGPEIYLKDYRCERHEKYKKDDGPEMYMKDYRRERREKYQKDDTPERYLKDYRRERHEKYQKDDGLEMYLKDYKPKKYQKDDRLEKYLKDCRPKKYHEDDELEMYLKDYKPKKYQKDDRPERDETYQMKHITSEKEQDLRIKLNKKRTREIREIEDYVKQENRRRKERSQSSDEFPLGYRKIIEYEIEGDGHRNSDRERKRERRRSSGDFHLKCKKVIKYEIKKVDGRKRKKCCERKAALKRLKYGETESVASKVVAAPPKQATNSSNKMWINKSFTKGLQKIPIKNFIDLISKKLDTIEEEEVDENLHLLHAMAFRCEAIVQSKMSDIDLPTSI